MASIVEGFEYDIFISYRQKDNKYGGWVTAFVGNLKKELEATFKEEVSIYFDENPHDGLLETHHVNKSLEKKLKCLIFIPILSHTYCDPKSYAWNHEFLPFCGMAKKDDFGLDVELANRNFASRILPVQIHDLAPGDQAMFEKETGAQLRAIQFIFRSQGVNRPLTPEDSRIDNHDRTFYRDQINKTANAIEAIVRSLASMQGNESVIEAASHAPVKRQEGRSLNWFWQELVRRNVFRAAVAYVVVMLLVHQAILMLVPTFQIEQRILNLEIWILLAGFPVAMVLAWFYELSPSGFIRTTSEQSEQNPYPASRKKPLTGSLLVTLLVILLTIQQVYYNYFRSNRLTSAPIKSIAVLPFENRSGDTHDDYIAEGITDDIINNLSLVSQLRVTNRKVIQEYKGELAPYDQIARELEVMALLIGSIQRAGDRIVIRAQMIDATDNSFIWGNTLHRTTNDIMAVQSEIAKVIVERLEIKLNELEELRLNTEPTDNATAYAYYLKGRSFYYKYQPEANDSAIFNLKKAVEADSTYAQAWAALADSYVQRYGRFAGNYAWTDSSLAAAKKAIRLDSTLSDGYKAMASAYDYREQYDQAFPLLLKAVELNPTNVAAVGNLGTNYLLRGELVTALYWQKKGAGMSPNNWINYQLIGWIYRLLGDLPNAESWLLKSLELNPMQYDTYELLGYTYVAQARKDDALQLIPSVLDIDENETRVLEAAGLIAHFAGDVSNAKKYFQSSIEKNENYKSDRWAVSPIGLGQILQQEGKRIDAEVLLTHALENNLSDFNSGSSGYEAPFNIACIYAVKGDKERSLEWLQKAIDRNWVDLAKFKHGPYFRKFHQDADFLKLLKPVIQKVDSMRREAKDL
ncbi:MAG: hypothetical protein AB7K37_13310 [Cyclobacteriaceae bacterium]